jgi:hypothetical protein
MVACVPRKYRYQEWKRIWKQHVESNHGLSTWDKQPVAAITWPHMAAIKQHYGCALIKPSMHGHRMHGHSMVDAGA